MSESIVKAKRKCSWVCEIGPIASAVGTAGFMRGHCMSLLYLSNETKDG